MNNTYDSLHTAGYKWRLDSYALLCLANLELGLRWLHDRCYTPLFSLPGQRHSTYWDGRLDGAVDAYYRSLPDAIELGLRWLNDRIEDDHRDQFGALIKSTFPSIINWYSSRTSDRPATEVNE